MQRMVRWVAASLALISLCCTPAIGLYGSRISRTAPELSKDVNLNKIDHDIPSTGSTGFSGHVPPTEKTNTDSTRTRRHNTAWAAGIPRYAFCEPELQPVTLDLPDSSFHPTCVRLERCGGCCRSDSLECRPTKNETVTLEVLKTGSRSDPTNPTYKVQAIKHVMCRCQCKNQEKHCNAAIHDYVERDCTCVCKNQADKTECEKDNNKLWNNDTCTCLCKPWLYHNYECTSGRVFSHTTCKCE